MKDPVEQQKRSSFARLRGGLTAGLVIGALAGGFIASEILYLNPVIHGFRNYLSYFLFFPALYMLVGGAVGLAAGFFSLFLPRTALPPVLRSDLFLQLWFILAVFLSAESLAHCYRCHQWYRSIWPSLDITPGESFRSFLLVLVVSVIVAALLAAVIRTVLRGASALLPISGGKAGAAALVAMFATLVAIPALREKPVFHPPLYSPDVAAGENVNVRLVILDGASWDFIQPLLDSGGMPHLQSLIDRGARGELGIIFPCISPYLWTCIATGVGDDVGGLCEFYGFLPPGATRPIARYGGGGNSKRLLFHKIDRIIGRRGIGSLIYPSSDQLKVPELWDYLSDAGRRVVVSGYRYSWPPTKVRGAMVTQKLGATARIWDPTTWPPELADSLRTDFKAEVEAMTRRMVGERLYSTPAEELGKDAGRLNKVRYQVGRDLKLAAAYRRLLDSTDPDFSVLGLTCIDALEHTFMVEYVLGRRESGPRLTDYLRQFTDEQAIEDLRETIPMVYSFADSLIGSALDSATENDLVIVISDHGHATDGSGHRFGEKGIIVMAGGPVRRGANMESPTVFDILPTVLHVMGLPVPVGVRGRVLSEILQPEWADAHEVRFISSEGKGSTVFGAGGQMPELTDEELENLKALGYID